MSYACWAKAALMREIARVATERRIVVGCINNSVGGDVKRRDKERGT